MEIERLLNDGELEHVAPSEDVANRLLANAGAPRGLAGKGVDDDPSGALQHDRVPGPRLSDRYRGRGAPSAGGGTRDG